MINVELYYDYTSKHLRKKYPDSITTIGVLFLLGLKHHYW
jgi:hypothetical protein